MTKTPLLLFIMLICLTSTAQFVPTTVKLKNDSLLTGFIKSENYKQTPAYLVFYPQENSNFSRKLLPNEVAEFKINGFVTYYGITVKRYTHALETMFITNIYNTEELKEQDTTETIFLQELIGNPKISLYSFTEKNRTNFFIQDSNKAIFPLRYLRIPLGSDKSQVQEYRYYQQQLQVYVQLNAKLLKKLSLLGWKEEEMINIINAFNHSFASQNSVNDSKEYKQAKNDFLPKTNLFVGLGLSGKNFSFVSPKNAYEPSYADFKFPVSISPILIAGVDIETGKLKKVINFQPSLAINYFSSTSTLNWVRKYDSKSFTDSYQVSGIGTLLNLSFKFKLAETFRVGFGITGNIDFYSKNLHSTNETSPNNGQLYIRTKLRHNSTFSVKGSLLAEYLINKKSGLLFSYELKSRDYQLTDIVIFNDAIFYLAYCYRFKSK